MERKYYLRGLGIGIVVTAIIMGIVTSHDRQMTDQEIIARAKELGMVENTVLSDIDDQNNKDQAKPDNGETSDQKVDAGRQDGRSIENGKETTPGGNAGLADEENKEDTGVDADREGDAHERDSDTANSDQTAGMDEGEDDESRETGEAEENQDSDSEKTGNNGIASANVRTITVSSGDGSRTVAQKLANAGLIMSVDNFDDFLCSNGYDKRLRTGTFSIPMDAGDERIARIITGAE